MNNERAFVMILSYVIGFSTAFLAFGVAQKGSVLTQQTNNHQKVQTEQANETTNTRIARADDANTRDTANSKTATEALVEDGSLYVVIEGKKIIVSADNKYGEGAGFHESVESYELINDGTELRFCIKTVRGQATCTSYKYSVNSHVVSRL